MEKTKSVSMDVNQARDCISDAIHNNDTNLISVIGPCPLVDEQAIIQLEARRKKELEQTHNNLIVLDRQCFTKPRSNPADWQGLDSSDPGQALQIVTDLSEEYANVSAEVRFQSNLENYGNHLSMVWTGARNIDDYNLIHLLATHDPSLPIGIKNGLDGNIELALDHVDYINDIRPEGSAPAILIYRGGENALNPKSSAEMYKRAHDATNGRIIRDNAHGVEMAHNPNGKFEKSVAGQIRASHAAIELAHQGYPPLGVMYEASQLESIMDPHIPLETAILHTELLISAKLGSPAVKKFVEFSNIPDHGFGSKVKLR
jgi:phospho-2-dehydro-3-deoxyheptonate aldolase